MARKLRLEFPGACYHVINRGNDRRNVFATEGTKVAFERCAFGACEKSGWLLHAFVVMRNHDHLAIEAPLGNLVAGMQWLKASFANRLNAVLSPALLPRASPEDSTRGLLSPSAAGLAGRRQVRQPWRRPNFMGETPPQVVGNDSAFNRLRGERGHLFQGRKPQSPAPEQFEPPS